MTRSANDSIDAKSKLYALLAEAASGQLAISEFCPAFETVFNFEVNKLSLGSNELAAFEELFERVVWYSPFREDIECYPGYLDEQAIKEAVQEAVRSLRVA